MTRKDDVTPDERRRGIVGFFTAEDGEVHPITASHAEQARARHRGKPRPKPAPHYTAKPVSKKEAAEWDGRAKELEAAGDLGDGEEWIRELERAELEREIDADVARGHTLQAAPRTGAGHVRGLGWVAMRNEIRSRGGIAKGPYTRSSIPGGLFRMRGEKPDLLAQELGWESADEMLVDLEREFATFRRAGGRGKPAPKRRAIRAGSNVANDPKQHLSWIDRKLFGL